MTSGPKFSLDVASGNDPGSSAHPSKGGGGFQAQFPGLGGDEIGNFVVLEVSPHVLNGIEFRRIGRQAIHHQSAPGRSDIILNQQTAVNRSAIPQDE